MRLWLIACYRIFPLFEFSYVVTLLFVETKEHKIGQIERDIIWERIKAGLLADSVKGRMDKKKGRRPKSIKKQKPQLYFIKKRKLRNKLPGLSV
ncbi:hypothetical protein [Xanthocytophaga agilis]|uniref:Uncharacterized protein n=1 Tax=Xanthocytophaga agilis TaxID=3048010 RepID=A0AAE3UJ37_9BACT|nr:hypothetical protein [Xanthocytophaga agilis]MDJ1505352.1 hypothetical protein [Xanthocytophaga agilis]